MKFIVALLLVPVALACVVPESGLIITRDTVFCSGSYFLDEGIRISGSDFVVECEGTSVLRGDMRNNGITIENAENISVRNCQIMHFDTGLFVQNASRIFATNNRLLRNKNGVRILSVENSTFTNYDVSLSSTFIVDASEDNVLTITNKRVVGDFCVLNKCNAKPDKSPTALEKLLRFLLSQLSM